MPKPIRVLIVDDSALVRELLTAMMSTDPDIEVVGTAADPIIARDKIKRLNPTVITLDVEMPRMDGIDFLEKIMTLRPMPVLMVSSLTMDSAEVTLRALEIGAVDVLAKPRSDALDDLRSKTGELVAKVKAAASAQVRRLEPAAAPARRRPLAVDPGDERTVVAIGASTGGVEALREILAAMPADAPAILVTQHMPANFTRSFAKRLDGLCAMSVREAGDGDPVLPGHVYLAPGGRHLVLNRSGATDRCRLLDDSDRVSGHCPSVDVLFDSFARLAGRRAVGVILTGMGRDGAEGLLAMRRAGARTIGQDERSSVVYGMPRAAAERGAVETELPLRHIADAILGACVSRAARPDSPPITLRAALAAGERP